MITAYRQQTPLHLLRRVEAPPACIFIVAEPFTVFVTDNNVAIEVTVPAGFRTNLASVPRVARSLVSVTDGIEASVVHDFGYFEHYRPKAWVDRLFYMMLEGQPAWRRRAMYEAVRRFGDRAWAAGR